MASRRQFLVVLATSGLLTPIVVWSGGGRTRDEQRRSYPRGAADADWRRRLSPQAYHVLREGGTEPPYSSGLHGEHRAGVFRCAGCAGAVFDAAAKFDSGTGWPSFVRPIDTALVETRVDRRYYQVRTEVVCAACGGHLGHVFPDGPPPTGLRYCINGVALVFEPSA